MGHNKNRTLILQFTIPDSFKTRLRLNFSEKYNAQIFSQFNVYVKNSYYLPQTVSDLSLAMI